MWGGWISYSASCRGQPCNIEGWLCLPTPLLSSGKLQAILQIHASPVSNSTCLGNRERFHELQTLSMVRMGLVTHFKPNPRALNQRLMHQIFWFRRLQNFQMKSQLLLWDPSPILLRSGLLLQIWGLLCFLKLMSTVLWSNTLTKSLNCYEDSWCAMRASVNWNLHTTSAIYNFLLSSRMLLVFVIWNRPFRRTQPLPTI